MIKNVYGNVRISGIAAAVSNYRLSLEECVADERAPKDFNLAKFIKSTGVKERYLCRENQTPSDLCVAAAEKMLTEKQVDREEIGVLVYVTQSPDYRSPATACVMQQRLGISQNCVAFDLNMGCSGFVYGINAIAGLLCGSTADKALLLCGDLTGQNMERDPISDSGYYLFGDGGGGAPVRKDGE